MFSCRGACARTHTLDEVADLPCNCLCCAACVRTSIGGQLDAALCSASPGRDSRFKSDSPTTQQQRRQGYASNPAALARGANVLYLDRRSGVFIEAVIEQVDLSCQPPQYGVRLPGAADLRFTEAQRLYPAGGDGAAVPGGSVHRAELARQQLDIRCPACGRGLSRHDVRALAPRELGAWEAACTESWLRSHAVVACPHPGCGALIQRVVDDPGGTSGSGGSGGRAGPGTSAAAAAAEAHRLRHRFRCGACRRDFCDACCATPYHAGLSCRQARAPDCLLCGCKVDEDRPAQLLPQAAAKAAAAAARAGGGRGSGGVVEIDSDGDFMEVSDGGDGVLRDHAAAGPPGSSGRGGPAGSAGLQEARQVVCAARGPELRGALQRLGVDVTECLERGELEEALMRWGMQTCGGAACDAKRKASCTRRLACGHFCCGVRSEERHPRCPACAPAPGLHSSLEQADVGASLDCCFCWSPLASAPCIELACIGRHLVHLECAVARLAAGYPGPHVTFTHLSCPLCGSGEDRHASSQVATGPVHLEHPLLAAQLDPHLQLRARVAAAAKARLRLDAELRGAAELQPGGRYDGRPADFALTRLLFFVCSKCQRPYFGGLRSCAAAAAATAAAPPPGGPGAPAGPAFNAQELMCGDCCATAAGDKCPRHGTEYIEFKCKFCCSLASWHCFGTTHMCQECHSDGTYAGRGPPKACTPATCKLRGVPHPPPGTAACLGCGMCRAGL